jgi:uncharacterized protein (DUF736 family)
MPFSLDAGCPWAHPLHVSLTLAPACAALNLSAKKFPQPDKPASSRPLRSKFLRLSGPPLCSGRSQARGEAAALAVTVPEPSQGTVPARQPSEPIMAVTLGTFSLRDDGSFTGILRTLNVNKAIVIAPVDKTSENAPTHRVYVAGMRYELGAGWSQVAKSSRETYIGLKLASPELGPQWLRCRLVKLEQPADDGATHVILWEARR